MQLKILLVDDEPLALRRLHIVLGEIEDVVIVGTAGGCEAARRAIDELRPDVVLLDIKMRDGSGLELAAELAEPPAPVVIFVTAYDAFATAAFDRAAADYVLKPVEVERLRRALDRARVQLQTRDAAERIAELQSIIAALREGSLEPVARPHAELWIRRNVTDFVRVPVAEIEWVEVEGDGYIRLHAGSRSYLQRSSIATFQTQVDPEAFVRVHRSTLVRVDAVAEVKRGSLGLPEVILTSGVRLSAGRVYAKQLRRRLSGRGADGRATPDVAA